MCRSAFSNALVCAARWCLEVISHRNTSQEIDFLRRISSTLLLCFLCAAFGVAQETKLLPPSQAVAPAIASADSGLKRSGAGKRWSSWYRLGVGKAPSGYTVQKTAFWLSVTTSAVLRQNAEKLRKVTSKYFGNSGCRAVTGLVRRGKPIRRGTFA